jgi:predicted DsbA family dithiol-disulfide isomerase
LAKEYDFDVQFEPFLLRPDIPPGGGPARRVQAPDDPKSPVELRGDKLGLTFTRGRTRTSYSHPALEAAEFANETSTDSWGFHKRLFKGYFEDLEDIEDVDTLVRIGDEFGLDAAALRTALEQGTYRGKVDEGMTWTRGIGVTAIPTFVFNAKFGMVGAHELEKFREVMQELGVTPRDEA